MEYKNYEVIVKKYWKFDILQKKTTTAVYILYVRRNKK